MGPDIIAGRGVMGDGGTRVDGVSAGVDGPEDEGEGLSTTHMRCERVATSFATVCARVLKGLTWKTGKESLPSFTPRSERMTDMKWMQEERRRGRDVVLVRSYGRQCMTRKKRTSIAYSNINMRDVTNDIVLGVKNGQRRDALIVHELESCR
jgi:hypothetical protein